MAATKTTHTKLADRLLLGQSEGDHAAMLTDLTTGRRRDGLEAELSTHETREPPTGNDRKPTAQMSSASSASVSPSSFQSLTTDSTDSLPGIEPDPILNTATTGTNHRNLSPFSGAPGRAPASGHSKSPILIKYNYYDYNGERQENHDIGSQQQVQRPGGGGEARIQRQLSPTFKQSLDQIVRSSQKFLAAASASPVSPQGSPIGSPSTLANGNKGGNGNGNNNNHLAQNQNFQHLSRQLGVEPSGPNLSQQNAYTMTLLARRYKLSSYEHRCLRCSKTVYQMDKVGPLKDFTFYHQNCFKCRECGTKLTLKTYFNNQHSSVDQEVYCHRHCPKTPAGKLDNQSVGIRAALNAPKVFDPITNQTAISYHQQLLAVEGQQQQYQVSGNNNSNMAHPYGQVDASAMHIQHAVRQTKFQAIYKHAQDDKKLSQFLNRRLEYLEPKQKLLEMRHREEEEQLFKMFEERWLREESSIREQIRDEWQRELAKLLEKYKQQLASTAASNLNLAQKVSSAAEMPAVGRVGDKHAQAIAAAAAAISKRQLQQLQQQQHHQASQTTFQQPRLDFHRHSVQVSSGASANPAADSERKSPPAAHEDAHEQRMIELERMNLEKTMTIKLDRKKETLKRKLREFERQATAELVEKQSREMITLISLKLEEFKEEQKRKIGSDLEQFEAIESLANSLGASLQISAPSTATVGPAITAPQARGERFDFERAGGLAHDEPAGLRNKRGPAAACAQTVSEQASLADANQQRQLLLRLAAPPLPRAPQLSKMDLYNSDRPDEVFKDIDELAINVAREDQQTFTDLVHHLTRRCLTDVEKCRAIFRWITVKNLNTMQFDSSIKPDTPLGLLRGIKQGSESYHVLFKRLCSYAGLHCVVIKGYSKSAGYQPGVRFEGSRFRNSWNAVFVAGSWRFVQCNWGARHLVSVAVMQDKNNSQSKRSQSNDRLLGQQQQLLAFDRPTRTGAIEFGGNQVPMANNFGRRGLTSAPMTATPNGAGNALFLAQYEHLANQQATGTVADQSGHHQHLQQLIRPGAVLSPASPTYSAYSTSSSIYSSSSSSSCHSPAAHSKQTTTTTNGDGGGGTSHHRQHRHHRAQQAQQDQGGNKKVATGDQKVAAQTAKAQKNNNSDSLRYEYDDHYFLTDPDEFIYEFFPLASEWQLLKTRPISLQEFEQLPFVRSLFFKYGLYFPQADIRSVLYTNSSGATTIKIGMPTHMIPSLIFHYNLKNFDSDMEHNDGISLKRFVMQSVESGSASQLNVNGNSNLASSGNGDTNQNLLSNIVSFRVHVPENGAYILDIFANSTTPDQYITGEPMKFKSVCKFKIIARNLKTVMVPLPDCASGEFGPMKATRLFGIIPLTHENGLISVQNDKRFLEIQFRMTRPLLDFMASLHKNGQDERQLSKLIKIFIDGDIVFIAIKFLEDGQYGLDIYTRDQQTRLGQQAQVLGSVTSNSTAENKNQISAEPKKQLLTHCCKYLINVKGPK